MTKTKPQLNKVNLPMELLCMLHPLSFPGSEGPSLYDIAMELEVEETSVRNYITQLREMAITIVVNAAGVWIPNAHWDYAKGIALDYWNRVHADL